jgi:hypothetical protein
MNPARLGPENDCAGDAQKKREDVTYGLQSQVFSWKIKILVVSLKGLGVKTN